MRLRVGLANAYLVSHPDYVKEVPTLAAARRCCATCCVHRSPRSTLSRAATGWCASRSRRPTPTGRSRSTWTPLSLLCRLATSVPPPRFHTVHYAGVLAAASEWRSRLAPASASEAPAEGDEPGRPQRPGGYRPWAHLLARTFAVDVLVCPRCQGRMKLLAIVKDSASIARYLSTAGEPTEVPRRSPKRGPPYWKSRVLRRLALGDEDAGQGQGGRPDQSA